MKLPAAFFEVSPFWAKVSSEAKTVKELPGFFDRKGIEKEAAYDDNAGILRSIQNWNTCIVGEAHHETFKDNNGYGCNECYNFSSRFGAILQGEYDGKGNRKQQLIQNIKDFTDHWRDEHNPLLHLDIETEETITVRP